MTDTWDRDDMLRRAERIRAGHIRTRYGRKHVLTTGDVNLIHEMRTKFNLSYRDIAKLTGLDHVTIWRGFHFAVPGAPVDYNVLEGGGWRHAGVPQKRNTGGRKSSFTTGTKR